MKTTIKLTLAILSIGAAALAAHAQDDGGGPPPGEPRGHRPPPLPLQLALDTNHDGVIDSNEIANASAELLTLDKNGDGQLTQDEYMPPRPPGADTMGQGFRPPPSPLINALDANHDGVIDSNEIANASAALKALDKNSDGQLTRDEFCPPRRGGMGHPPGGGGSPDDGPPGPPPNQ